MWAMLCYLLVGGATGSHIINSVEFKPFTTEPGIYFAELGRVMVSTSEWKFVIYYNLTTYWHEWEHLQEIHRRLQETCENPLNFTSYIRNCKGLMQPITYAINTLNERNEILRAPTNRARRSPLDFVRNLLSDLFGVLDQRDAQKYHDQLQQLADGTVELQALVQQQTHVLDLTTNLLRKEKDLIDRQYQSLHSDLDKIMMHEEFVDGVLQLTSAMWVLKDVQSDLIDILSDVHHGRSNTQLIPPAQLEKQLGELQYQVPTTTRIPTGKKHWVHVYKLLTTKAGIIQDQVIFEVRLPLLHRDEFQGFNIIPVPTRHEDKFVFIDPEFRNILINDHRTWYYPISAEALKKCKTWEEGSLICTLEGPLYNMQSPEVHCEVALLTHAETPPRQCQVKSVLPAPYFRQLQNNRWIMVLPSETVFDFQCQQQIQPVSLQGSGVLTLPPDCSLRGKSVLITSHNVYMSSKQAVYIPMFNLSREIATREVFVGSTDMDDEITGLRQTITGLQGKEHWRPGSFPHVGHYAVTGAMFLIMLVLVVMTCKHQTRWRHNHANERGEHRPVARPPYLYNARIT